MSAESVRILLGETASKALLEQGECFVMACKASYPDTSDRVALHLVPISREDGEKLSGVLLGTHKVSKIKAAKEG